MAKHIAFLLFLATFTFNACNQVVYEDTEFDIINDQRENPEPGDPDDDYGDEGGDGGELTLYRVDGVDNTFVKDYDVADEYLSAREDKARHRETWDYVVRLLPIEARKTTVEFEDFRGEGGLLGYVFPVCDEKDLSQGASP